MRNIIAAALAAIVLAAPAHADQLLGQGRIDSGNRVVLPGGPTLGKWQGGRYNATPDVLTLPSTDLGSTGNVSGMSVTLPSTIARRLADKLGEQKSIADYVIPSDNGDYALAIERAAAAGVTELLLPSGPQYTFKRKANLPNANMRITCQGKKTTEIRLLGTNNFFFDVGNTTTMSYNFYIQGCLFTKETASTTQGAVLRMRNIYKWGFDNIRVFGENKIWHVLELLSASSGVSRDVDVDNILERAVYATGTPTGAGAVNGWAIDEVFDLWYVLGANSVVTDPATSGVFYFDDCFQAVWILNAKVGLHKGYAFFFNGTVANRGINTLNFVFNPNVESSLNSSGTAYFGAVGGSQVGGPASWSTGKGMAFPAIKLGANSAGIFVRGIQIGVAAGGYAVEDDGTSNTIEDMDLVGYDNSADTGLVIGPTASGGRYNRNKVEQFQRAIYDNSPDAAGGIIRGLDYRSISGQPLTGLIGSANSTKIVDGINSLDAAAPTVGVASTIFLPDKGSAFRITGTGTIGGITPTYIGRKVTLLLTISGQSISDLASASGVGAFYLAKPLPATTDGRTRITVEWRGDYWWEIARVP